MPKYSNDYFGRQQRLADQEREAMRHTLKIQDADFKKPKSYDRRGEGGTKVAPMPGGVYYEEPNMLRKFLDYLRITPPDQRFIAPKPAGRQGYI